MAEDCPACGVVKSILEDPFCPECTERLPQDLLENVTERSTYIEAFAPSLRHLRRDDDAPQGGDDD